MRGIKIISRHRHIDIFGKKGDNPFKYSKDNMGVCNMIEKVVSGGQTGADQAGLLAASEMGIEVGGWCPKGGLDENGIDIRQKYSSFKEASISNLDERTKLNILDSDGTLIIVPSWPLPEKIKDGTLLTIEHAKEKQNHN